jgi:hypothetical protein
MFCDPPIVMQLNDKRQRNSRHRPRRGTDIFAHLRAD